MLESDVLDLLCYLEPRQTYHNFKLAESRLKCRGLEVGICIDTRKVIFSCQKIRHYGRNKLIIYVKAWYTHVITP